MHQRNPFHLLILGHFCYGLNIWMIFSDVIHDHCKFIIPNFLKCFFHQGHQIIIHDIHDKQVSCIGMACQIIGYECISRDDNFFPCKFNDIAKYGFNWWMCNLKGPYNNAIFFVNHNLI